MSNPARSQEVSNQSGAFSGVNLFDNDIVLRHTARREGAEWVSDRASRLGAAAGDPEWQEHAHLANKHTPVFRGHDRFGHRIDQVDFHPSYHALMGLAFGSGVHSLAWTANRAGAHVARATLSYLWNQIESGVGCPTGMTYSSVPVFQRNAALLPEVLPKILVEDYDPRPLPMTSKRAVTIGMALTEKQGGSDLRANITWATRMSGGGGLEYSLTGHKWFCSAPMSDAFLTLAQTDSGPSCFYVPRSLPDGTRNRFFIQRLKDKCGNRSNASCELEYSDTYAILIGDEGRGIRTALEMAHLTRLDFAVGSAGLMRHALSLTLHHTINRRAFQKALVDQPMMRNVLADLCIESEAATVLAFRLARAIDRSHLVEHERLIERLLTPVAKFWNAKRAPAFVAECVEAHGGNGFIEEQPMPRLYREAPLNGIWEGAGNVICLDVLRALNREPDCVTALMTELAEARGADSRLDHYFNLLEAELRDHDQQEARGRQITIMIATAIEAALLVRHSTEEVADAYILTRCGSLPNRAFGSLPRGIATRSIVERSRLS